MAPKIFPGSRRERGTDWLSVSPSIHFFVHGQTLFLEIGRTTDGRRVPQRGARDEGGGGNGFMMPLDPEIGVSECERDRPRQSEAGLGEIAEK